ncbi:MAG: hypothetical protein O2904_00820 [bacterium]|nr:hypothetical protein [bacterium]
MANFFINLSLILIGVAMIKWRESAGDMIGEAEWMRYCGGIYGLMMICGTLLVFFSIARMTGTTDIFFAPLIAIIPTGENLQ